MSAARPRVEPEFKLSEFFETLIRVRDSQPRRCAREVSAGMHRRVELYEEQKRAADGRAGSIDL